MTSKNTTKNKIWGPNFPAAFGGRKIFELFDQKMLISKGKMVKTATFFWPPSAAGIFFELFDQKIAISKGEMVKTAIFSGAPAARQKFFGPPKSDLTQSCVRSTFLSWEPPPLGFTLF